MTLRMYAPRKMEWPNGKYVFIGEVYGHPEHQDGKMIRSGFVERATDDAFEDSDGLVYHIPEERPEAEKCVFDFTMNDPE